MSINMCTYIVNGDFEFEFVKSWCFEFLKSQ